MSPTSAWRIGRLATTSAFLIASVLGFLPGLAATPASAAPITYDVAASSGQFTLKKGDPNYERIIANPSATLSGSIDDTTGAITANATVAPSYTANQAAPFGLVVYIKADVIQQAPFTGYADASGAIDASGQDIMAITVYRTTTGTVGQSDGQNPATDQVLANGSTCRVTLDLHLTGQYDFQNRLGTIGQDPFTIPQFPADTRSTGGTAGCTSATATLNQQLAGPSNSVTLTFGGSIPGHVPAAPGQVTATGGNAQATLSGPAPSEYGSPITGYVITPYIAGVPQPTQTIPAAGPPVVTGLTNGVTYTFTAAATNANGTGPASAQSNPVLIGVPAKPGFQSATPGTGTAQVKFWPPSDNGTPITSYTITPYVAGVAQPAQTFLGNGNVHTLTGLTSGASYTFVIVANNAIGAGVPSTPTAPVTIG
jgi:hypothetical protein